MSMSIFFETRLSLPSCALLPSDGRDSTKCAACKWWYRRLHANFNRLEGTQGNICNEFGGCTGAKIE